MDASSGLAVVRNEAFDERIKELEKVAKLISKDDSYRR